MERNADYEEMAKVFQGLLAGIVGRIIRKVMMSFVFSDILFKLLFSIDSNWFSYALVFRGKACAPQ